MVPFHDSDLAENRWKEGEWRQFELWERIEVRLRQKRFWTIVGVAILFLAILALPVIQDRSTKWSAESAMRKLAVHAGQIKVDAAALGAPLRLRLENSAAGPVYLIERVQTCMESLPSKVETSAQEWARGVLFSDESKGKAFVVLSAESAKRFGMERVVESFCYDPREASNLESSAAAQAIGVISVKDLAEGRLDRIAFLNFSGPFAEIDFD